MVVGISARRLVVVEDEAAVDLLEGRGQAGGWNRLVDGGAIIEIEVEGQVVPHQQFARGAVPLEGMDVEAHHAEVAQHLGGGDEGGRGRIEGFRMAAALAFRGQGGGEIGLEAGAACGSSVGNAQAHSAAGGDGHHGAEDRQGLLFADEELGNAVQADAGVTGAVAFHGLQFPGGKLEVDLDAVAAVAGDGESGAPGQALAGQKQGCQQEHGQQGPGADGFPHDRSFGVRMYDWSVNNAIPGAKVTISFVQPFQTGKKSRPIHQGTGRAVDSDLVIAWREGPQKPPRPCRRPWAGLRCPPSW